MRTHSFFFFLFCILISSPLVAQDVSDRGFCFPIDKQNWLLNYESLTTSDEINSFVFNKYLERHLPNVLKTWSSEKVELLKKDLKSFISRNPKTFVQKQTGPMIPIPLYSEGFVKYVCFDISEYLDDNDIIILADAEEYNIRVWQATGNAYYYGIMAMALIIIVSKVKCDVSVSQPQ
jgi:hypothetical protein